MILNMQLFTEPLKSLSMADNHAEEMLETVHEMMEVDGAIGGERTHQDLFEEKKAMLEELERAGVEGVEDMAVEKCLTCGFAWIEQLLNRSR